jgi:non-heme chloroperoxidase
MRREDDQVVPDANHGPLTAKLLRNGTLKSYKDFPHGMITTQADTVNAELRLSSKPDKRALLCARPIVASN